MTHGKREILFSAKKRHAWHCFLAIVSMVLTLFSCNNKADLTLSATKKIVHQQLTSDDRARFDLAFHEAINHFQQGNHDAAFDLFNYCLSLDSTQAEIYDYLNAYHFKLDNTALASDYTKRAVALAPENIRYAENYGRYLITLEQYKEAAEVIQKIIESDHHRTDLIDVLIRIYLYTDDNEAALRMLEKKETLEGADEATTLAKMQIYQSMGNKEQEMLTLQRLVERYPYEPNYRVMLGNWFMNHDETEKAFAEYEKVRQEEPGNVALRTSLIDYYKHEGLDDEAEAMMNDIIFDRKTDIDVRGSVLYDLISLYERQQRETSVAIETLDKLIAEEPEETLFMMMKGAYLKLKNMPKDDIMDVMRMILKVEPDNADARYQLLELLWQDENYDEVIAVSRPGNDYNPDNMVFYYFLGLAYLQRDDLDNALDALQRGVTQINEESNKDIASDFYAIMGDILHRQNRNEEAYDAYENSLLYKADNYVCLNNYAYFLALEGEQLDKAEAMSRKVIEGEPGNPTYLDTLAWILFLEGKYDEAHAYIDRVIMLADDPSDVVKEHVGDIYAVSGLIDEAVGYWKEALETDGNNALLKEKIKERKYIAPKK